MASEVLLNTIRNAVAIDRAIFAWSNGLRVGQTIDLSDPNADRMLKLKGFSVPEAGGRWTDCATASIDLKLSPESERIGHLRLHIIPFVTATKGQTLRLCCGTAQEQVVHFPPGEFAWQTVDLPIGDLRADRLARIQIAVDHTFVPSELGLSSDSRALGVMIRQIKFLGDAVPNRVEEQVREPSKEPLKPSKVQDLVPLALGSSISLASPDAEQLVRLTGFSRPEATADGPTVPRRAWI
jgi:hypothetical protein